MNPHQSFLNISEQAAPKAAVAGSLQGMVTKLSSASVQDRLKNLRQDHAQVRVLLDTFH